MIIKSKEGSGKKTFLVKWKEYHEKNSKNVMAIEFNIVKFFGKEINDIIIMHFASSGKKSSNYFYAIYRILIQLRVILI